MTILSAPASHWSTYIDRNLKTSISSLLKPWRFCRNSTGPREVSRTAIATAIMSGDRANSIIRPTLRSNRAFSTTSQSAIGRSNTSNTGTEPRYE